MAVFAGRGPEPVVPPRGPHLVPRRRLDALFGAVLQARLVLVSAPAGAGKTTALADAAARWDGPVAWCPLERRHDDPAVFWPFVAAALGVSGEAAGATADVVLAGVSGEGERRRLLVLDDYHLIASPEIHAGVTRLVATTALPVHVALATRHDPPLPLARWRADGTLREVRLDDLRFDEPEVRALVEHVTGVALSTEQLGLLHRRTEGWAVGVHLAALSLGQQEDSEAFVHGFAGDDRHVADYLRDEVLSRVPDHVREFLLETALLDRLTAPLCEAVTGRAGAQDLLEDVERRNLFLVPLDHRRRWYRYHHLFAEWLRLRPPPGIEERHRRAAAWLEANGFPGDALPHLLAAGDVRGAVALVDRERWVLVGQARQATLRDWVAQLPPQALAARTELATAAAWVAYDQGRWEEVERLVEILRSGGSGTAAAEGEEDGLLRAEIALLDAGRQAALGRLEDAGRSAAAALDLVPKTEPRARTGLLLVLGKARLAEQDLVGARAVFAEAEALATAYDVHVVALIASCHLAEVARREGRASAKDDACAALELAERHALSDHPECAVAHVTLGHLLLDEGHRQEARAHAERAADLAARVRYEPRAAAVAELRSRLGTRPPTGAAAGGPAHEALTKQERALLRLLPSTLTTREIAGELCVSANTVKTHARTLYRKLGVQSRHAAIETARSRGLL